MKKIFHAAVLLLTVLSLFISVIYIQAKDDTITMYSADGRTLVIHHSEVEAYENVGWYQTKEEVTRTLYSLDGREITVWLCEVEAYKSVGWFENKSDVTRTLYAPDGRTITVFQTEVEAYVKVGWFLSPGNGVDPTKPMVALTFDDGPAPEFTERILNALEKYDSRATFYVVGNRVSYNHEILRRMSSMKCQIGNHSYSHPNLKKASYESVAYQINNTAEQIFAATGQYPDTIRPPYGEYDERVMAISNQAIVLWSLDTLDWKYRDAGKITDIVLSTVRDGDVILMHDIYESTAQAAETIIPELINRGFQLVTVRELSVSKCRPLYAGNVYYYFR